MLKKLKLFVLGVMLGEEKFVVVKYITAVAFWFKLKCIKLDVCVDEVFVDFMNKLDCF